MYPADVVKSRTANLEARILELESDIANLESPTSPRTESLSGRIASHALFENLRKSLQGLHPRSRSLVEPRLLIYPDAAQAAVVANIVPLGSPPSYPFSVLRHVVEIPLMAWDTTEDMPLELRKNL